LWHGCSLEGAKGISKDGFDISRCGSGAGSMYGAGFYLAECTSKSDEYAKDSEDGVCCLLLVRAVLGEVLHMTAGGAAVHAMIDAALKSGSYDSILGNREASVGTYKEFVVYQEPQCYPEYVIRYKRKTAEEMEALLKAKEVWTTIKVNTKGTDKGKEFLTLTSKGFVLAPKQEDQAVGQLWKFNLVESRPDADQCEYTVENKNRTLHHNGDELAWLLATKPSGANPLFPCANDDRSGRQRWRVTSSQRWLQEHAYRRWHNSRPW